MIKGNAMLLGSQEGLSLYSIDNAGEKATLKVKVASWNSSKYRIFSLLLKEIHIGLPRRIRAFSGLH